MARTRVPAVDGGREGSLLLRIRRLLSAADGDQTPARGGLLLLGTGAALAAAVMVLAAVSAAAAQDGVRPEAGTGAFD